MQGKSSPLQHTPLQLGLLAQATRSMWLELTLRQRMAGDEVRELVRRLYKTFYVMSRDWTLS